MVLWQRLGSSWSSCEDGTWLDTCQESLQAGWSMEYCKNHEGHLQAQLHRVRSSRCIIHANCTLPSPQSSCTAIDIYMAYSCIPRTSWNLPTSPITHGRSPWHCIQVLHITTGWNQIPVLPSCLTDPSSVAAKAFVVKASVQSFSSVRFFAPKMRNHGLQPVQDRPKYWGNQTKPPRTGILRSMALVQTDPNWFFCIKFVIPI